MTDIINASPTKRFFVEMLTRDIDLDAALLDLLDNCIDGVMRSNPKTSSKHPYKGFYANIIFKKDKFIIEDNCGGISLDLAKDFAFRMGRPKNQKPDNKETVGIYGIGMKRAIFKMGENCVITTQTKKENYKIHIDSKWLKDDKNWELPYKKISKPFKNPGTKIEITSLYKSVSELFSSRSSTFFDDLWKRVSESYCYLILKGFEVKINGKKVVPKSLKILWPGDLKKKGAITPYIYKKEIGSVTVDLAVGFYRGIPTDEEIEAEKKSKMSSETAGWTIICNDRVVLYCDKSRMTGWATANVPAYHTQFIAISGVVHFHSTNPWDLPLNSTKRGVDAGSDLYLSVKDYMMEGMKKFTSFTNKWKEHKEEKDLLIEKGKEIEFDELFKTIGKTSLKKVSKSKNEYRHTPALPTPREKDPNKLIRFFRLEKDIRILSNYLFDTFDANMSDVGGECFDRLLKKAKGK